MDSLAALYNIAVPLLSSEEMLYLVESCSADTLRGTRKRLSYIGLSSVLFELLVISRPANEFWGIGLVGLSVLVKLYPVRLALVCQLLPSHYGPLHRLRSIATGHARRNSYCRFLMPLDTEFLKVSEASNLSHRRKQSHLVDHTYQKAAMLACQAVEPRT